MTPKQQRILIMRLQKKYPCNMRKMYSGLGLGCPCEYCNKIPQKLFEAVIEEPKKLEVKYIN